MLATDDCAPTPLFPTSKNPFRDLSDSRSVSSLKTVSDEEASLNDLDDIAEIQSAFRPPKKYSTMQDLLDAANNEEEQNSQPSPKDSNDRSFNQEFYDRVEEFLDQEQLFMQTPSPFGRARKAKQSMTVVLQTSFLTRSEPSTVIDGDSPFSEDQGLSGPSFLVRRTISGGLRPTSMLFNSPPLLKSESVMDWDCTPTYSEFNFVKRVHSETKSVHQKESFNVDA